MQQLILIITEVMLKNIYEFLILKIWMKLLIEIEKDLFIVKKSFLMKIFNYFNCCNTFAFKRNTSLLKFKCHLIFFFLKTHVITVIIINHKYL